MIHPDLEKWQIAKRAAFAIAATIKNCEVIQTPDGKTKRVILGKKVIDCTSWFGAYCFLHRIKLDQITHGGTTTDQEPPKASPVPSKPPPRPAAPQRRQEPLPPMATFCD